MKTSYLWHCLSAIGLVFLLGCGVKDINLNQLATVGSRIISGNKLTLQQQQNIGEKMAAVVIGSSKLHRNEKLQKYVNRVGRWVAKQSKANRTQQWQFVVIDTPDFNAFSMPGGYIVISSGVIDRLSSEAELAAVLAHEIVHIEQKHMVKAIESSRQFSDMGALALDAADSYSSSNKSYLGNTVNQREIAQGLMNITHNLYTKGLGRDDELDADKKAVVLMTRAGYDPYAYLTVMQLIESIDENNKTLILASHPKVSDRLKVVSNTLNYVAQYSNKTKAIENRFINSVQ